MVRYNLRKISIIYLVPFLFFFSSVKGQIIVRDIQKISSIKGGFPNNLDNNDRFGTALSPIGDLDNNGVSDLVVGVVNDDDGGPDRGAIYILYLNTDNTVKSYKKISSIAGNFTGPIGNYSSFGIAAEAIGDINGDGIVDIAVGANYDSEAKHQEGAVWILFLNNDGTVQSHQKINSIHGNFNRTLPSLASFGSAICSLGDLNGDGVNDIAVGAYRDNSSTSSKTGAIYILFLNKDGTVKSSKKIAESEGGFTGSLNYEDYFGGQVAPIGDLDNDDVVDIAVSAFVDDDGGNAKGAVWVLFLNPNGSVKANQKISSISGNFQGKLNVGDFFGASLTSLGDINNDGIPDLAVGADRDKDSGTSKGAVWILYLTRNGTVSGFQKISDKEGCFTDYLKTGDHFGGSIAVINNPGNEGIITLAVGAVLDDDGGEDRGAVYMLTLDKLNAPNAGNDVHVCDGSVILNAEDHDKKFSGKWSVLIGSGKILEPDNSNTEVVNLSDGKNSFTWSISNGTCQLEDTVTVFYELSTDAFAGEDQILCSDSTFLDASQLNNDYQGEWQVLKGEGSVIESKNSFSKVIGLSPGENKFIWAVKNLYCSDSDTVTITYDDTSTILQAGEDKISCKNQMNFEAFEIPLDSKGVWEVISGDAEINDPSDPFSEVINLTHGENSFIYNVSECRGYKLKVIYNPLNSTHFPNVITPNNDNKNDYLFFQNIEDYPQSELTIVNRWGKVILETRGYLNNWDCKNCVSGVYFYRLKVNECLDYKGPVHVLK